LKRALSFVAATAGQECETVSRTLTTVRIWRRSERRKADDLARLLLSLERLAYERRPGRTRDYASIGIR